MAPSASKQKRLAEKAAKKAAAGGAAGSDAGSTTLVEGSSTGTNTPNVASKRGSEEDLLSMAKLNIATDRCVLARELWA